EVSPNKRAGCTDAVCKKEGLKIQKGDLRFGSWTIINEHGSWRWKHWGCVSGSQLVNLQEACGNDPDNYDFDAIDGFDELQDEELKEKVKRCVRQGHIDPEDFNGVSLL
ncbi:zf-PARP-domain-containing protein, partial [Trichoderma citrinoviride]